MNKIIISGISGFVGQNLVRYLESKYEILGVSRGSLKNTKTFSYKDLNQKSLDDTLAFIHLAGKAHDLKNVTSEKEYFEINKDLTISVFNKFIQSDCEIFIFMSTVKAVADKVEGILTEDTFANPVTAYGKSKLEAEQYLLSRSLPINKKLYILRPCMIHGPNNKGNLNLLYRLINIGIPYPFGKYNNKRSFVSIDNLCFILEQLLQKKAPSGIYNIADNKSLSTNEVVNLIGEATERKALILNLPIPIITFFAFLGDILKMPFNSERLEKLTENYVVSNQKIKSALNVDLPVEAHKGLYDTIQSFAKKKN